MIPGRVNILTVEVDEPGVSRGQCAEYCGGAHALMSLYVIAMAPEEYATWLAAEMRPARMPLLPMEREGQALFLANGCGACHAIRGTEAKGMIGPDLTHVGSRMSLAAASLPNNPEAFASWIVHNQSIKPENQMPAFQYLDSSSLQAIAVYLDSLE
jgi:cytochrome c oxidase subunit 2